MLSRGPAIVPCPCSRLDRENKARGKGLDPMEMWALLAMSLLFS